MKTFDEYLQVVEQEKIKQEEQQERDLQHHKNWELKVLHFPEDGTSDFKLVDAAQLMLTDFLKNNMFSAQDCFDHNNGKKLIIEDFRYEGFYYNFYFEPSLHPHFPDDGMGKAYIIKRNPITEDVCEPTRSLRNLWGLL